MAETADGGLLLTLVGDNLYETVLAKLTPAGDVLWVKRPAALQGYQPYSVVPWGNGRYFIAAQKPLVLNRLKKGLWDCVAGVVIDGEGTVLDSDILPQHWTFPAGGILPAGNGRYVITGIGGADPKLGMKQPDIALYVLDTK